MTRRQVKGMPQDANDDFISVIISFYLIYRLMNIRKYYIIMKVKVLVNQLLTTPLSKRYPLSFQKSYKITNLKSNHSQEIFIKVFSTIS